MTSIRKLAELAGVSRATVSRALLGQPYVAPEKKARILELAEQCHYRPNRLAQGVLAGRSRLLGILWFSLSDSFFSRVLSSVMRHAFSVPYHAVMMETGGDPRHTRDALHALIEQRVEGAIINSGHDAPLPRQSLLELRSHNVVPIAVDVTHADLPLDIVRSDETQMAELAVEYLRSLGHRDIGYMEWLGMADKISPRREAVLAALYQKNSTRPTARARIAERLWPTRQMRLYHSTGHLPTAIIAFNDAVALRVIRMLAQNTIAVPGEVSVLGYGTFSFSGDTVPAITSIEQHPDEIGRLTFELFHQRIQQQTEGLTMAPEIRCVPAELAVQESCAPVHPFQQRIPMQRLA